MATKSSNHAMERTADRGTLHFGDDFHTSTPSGARSRPPSLILLSLDVKTCLTILVLFVAAAASPAEDDKVVQQALANLREAMDARERVVLYELDHVFAAKKLRELGAQLGWQRTSVSADDQRFPLELQRFKPCCVWLFPDYSELQFGGAFGDIGFRAFRTGLVGYGTKKLGEGIWYYAQDGRVPAPQTSNQSLQPTASRRTAQFHITRTIQPAATRALARRG